MPYKISSTEGMERITQLLEVAGDRAQGVAAMALYQGAGIIADAISREAGSIHTQPFRYAKNGEKRDPSPEEKAILTANGAAGIAKFDKDGLSVNTSIGYNRSGHAMVNWNHMRSRTRTNYKIKNMQPIWSGKAYLERGSNGHAQYNRGKGGLTNAKPVAVIANAINSGTSFMNKQPFIRKAISKSKQPAMDAIEKTMQALVAEMFKSA